MGVSTFLSDSDEAKRYDYFPKKRRALPDGWTLDSEEDGRYGRVAVTGAGQAINGLWRTCVPYWAEFVQSWRGTPHG
ncbi:MAG: hypothetical protein M5U34_36155 [Chloroflexi bacterium]|nr:hypothetical protein [Chloroflexota bacterium]